MRGTDRGMLILNAKAQMIWREAFRQPGGGRCDLLRFMREMDLCCSGDPKRFARAEVDFEACFGGLLSAPFSGERT